MSLVTQKRLVLLCILLAWTSYLVVYLLLTFQPTNLLFPFVIVYCLAAAGLTAVIHIRDARERYLWSFVLAGLIAMLIGWDVSLSFLASTVILLLGLWIVWKVLDRSRISEVLTSAALVFLIFLMSLIQDSLPLPKLRKLGIAPDERAVLFLQKHWPERTPVAAYSFIVPWAAKMTYVGLLKSERDEIRSAHDLQHWIANENLHVIYTDHSLERSEPALWTLIENEIGKSLEVAFSSQDDEKIRILRVKSRVSESEMARESRRRSRPLHRMSQSRTSAAGCSTEFI